MAWLVQVEQDYNRFIYNILTTFYLNYKPSNNLAAGRMTPETNSILTHTTLRWDLTACLVYVQTLPQLAIAKISHRLLVTEAEAICGVLHSPR